MAERQLETYDNLNDKVIGGFTHDGKTLKPKTRADADLAATIARVHRVSVHSPALFDHLKHWGNGYVVVREPGDPIKGHDLPANHPALKTRRRLG